MMMSEVPIDWLSKIAATFAAHPDTDALYGPVHIPPDGIGKAGRALRLSLLR